MADAIHLADPDFEPTDEQLLGLSRCAFAGVTARHEAALAKLRAEIETARAQARSDLTKPTTAPGTQG